MTIIFVEKQKRQKKLIAIFVAVLLVTIIVLWRTFYKKSSLTVPQIAVQTPAVLLEKIEIDFKILEHPILNELKPFSEIQPFEGQIGRVNPFLSY